MSGPNINSSISGNVTPRHLPARRAPQRITPVTSLNTVLRFSGDPQYDARIHSPGQQGDTTFPGLSSGPQSPGQMDGGVSRKARPQFA